MSEFAVAKGGKASTGPVEVASLSRLKEKENLAQALAKENEKGRLAGTPPAPEVRLAKEVATMDREALQRAGHDQMQKAGSIMNLLEKNHSGQGVSNSDPSLIGLEFKMSFGGPKGSKNQFNAEVTGIVGTGLSTVVGAAEYVTAGTKAGEVLQKINPNKALNNAIEKATGMENNPNIDTRSANEISLTNALDRYANAEKWAGAARKEGFTGYDKKADPQVNAVNYSLALLQPSLDEFKSKHPNISQADMKKVRAEAIDMIMADKPYSDSGFTGGLKKLLRQSPSTGLLENGKLSADSREYIQDRLKSYYSELREGAKKD